MQDRAPPSLSGAMRRGGPAFIASVCLHGAAALALFTPWPPPPKESRPPMMVELVLAPPAGSSRQGEPAAASPPDSGTPPPPSPAPAANPARAHSSPPPRSRPALQQMTGRAAAPPARMPAADTAAEGGGKGRDGGTAPAAGDGLSSPPGYVLGTASTPAPDYPWSARRRGIEGRVVIRLEVGADGRPTQVELIHGSGSDALDQAALAALWHWRLRPAMAEGAPVAGLVVVPIVFKLT